MKKSVLFILCLLTCFYYLKTNTYNNIINSPTTKSYYSKKQNTYSKDNAFRNKYQNMHESLSKKIIRFHVIGNSNSYEDQAIKLKIKDTIVRTYSPLFRNVNNFNCARQITLNNLDNITKTAMNILSNHDISYSVKTNLSTRTFPIKQYGNTILPAGEYEAVSIQLGEAKGRNWWCVFYPSLCVVNTNPKNTIQGPDNTFGNILTAAEYDYITYKPSTKITYTSFFSDIFF